MSTRCQDPFMKKDENKNSMPLPCGKCPACLKRRVSGWSFRLTKQAEVSTSALFVTITYDTKNVPITKNGYMTVSSEDVTNFFKRLRRLEQNKISYFLASEYGGRTKRPHYHAIIFNTTHEKIIIAWALKNQPLGAIHFGDVNGASIGYTLKYMCKPRDQRKHQNHDIELPFQRMSKGLGKNYLTDKMIQWHHQCPNERMYVNLKDGKKIAMPRYYKQKIYNAEQRGEQKGYWEKKIKEIQELAIAKGEIIGSKDAYEQYQRDILKMHKNATKNETL